MPAVRHLRIDSIEVVPDRLDTGYYSYDYFSAKNRLQDSGIPFVEIGAVCEPWCFGAYALCNEIEWCAKEEGIPYVKAEALGAPLLNDSGLSYITPATNTLLAKSQLTAGDIIVSTSGTVGMCAVIPEYIQEINSNQDTIKFRPPKERFDPYFVVAWISTPTAQAILDRESGGAVQKHIYLHNFQQIPLLEPRLVVQQYIGEKVRQAERLQRVAIQLSLRLTNLASMPLIRDALEIQRVRTNRVRADRFTGYRLDSKYYSARALAILEACKHSGAETIRALEPVISNGFESRVFVENGHPYLTVSEISSGRVDIRHAPRIDFSITVPQKASTTRNCVLVVRSGSLGIAAKVHRNDEGAAISSHLIRLEFGDEELAAAVAVFLDSLAGRELMVRASYGAVIPQLGQEELLDIPIPKHVLSLKRPILNLLNSYEQAIRIAGILVQSAKLLVEALIEGKITEDEIAEAQTQLEHSDQTGDRAILARLYEGGIGTTEGIPLFNDLDMYYETLRLAEKTDENEPTNDANYCL